MGHPHEESKQEGEKHKEITPDCWTSRDFNCLFISSLRILTIFLNQMLSVDSHMYVYMCVYHFLIWYAFFVSCVHACNLLVYLYFLSVAQACLIMHWGLKDVPPLARGPRALPLVHKAKPIGPGSIWTPNFCTWTHISWSFSAQFWLRGRNREC